MHEAILEDGLGDHAGALGHGVEHGELGLHVGREGRVGGRLDGDRLEGAVRHVQADPVVPFLDEGARLFQLDQHGFQQGGIRLAADYLAAGDGGADQEGSGFDTVWLDAVAATVQTLNTVDGQGIRAGSLYLGA